MREKLSQSLLIVDDDEDIVESMAHSLGRVFETCLTARNGVEALEILAREKVDIILTDMTMPKMDGYDLIKTVLEKYTQIKHINIITGHANEGHLKELSDLDIPIFMKPVSLKMVRDKLIEEFN